MTIDRYERDTIVTASRGSYLKLKSEEDSEKLIGRPERIIFSNSKEIPEFEEVIID